MKKIFLNPTFRICKDQELFSRLLDLNWMLFSYDQIFIQLAKEPVHCKKGEEKIKCPLNSRVKIKMSKW
jgi:hypothetical protein